MKDVIKNMLEHPLASVWIIGSIGGGIAGIIRAIKGIKNEPIVSINTVEKKEA